MKHTPFYTKHLELGAKMAEFASFSMPIYYTSIKQEHLAVRNMAGLFDVSHMGEFIIRGEAADQFISSITPNNVAKISTGKVQYSALLNEQGTFIDDILIYGLDVPHTFMLVVNASNIEKDATWIKSFLPSSLTFIDISDDTCLLALQGPQAEVILQSLVEVDLSKVLYYSFVKVALADIPDVLVSATGYTGERGFEIFFDKKYASQVWDALFDAGSSYGLLPAGLGARDTLRIEKGYSLYGHEIDETLNPLDAQLSWIVKNPHPFVGKSALENYQATQTKVGFSIEGRGISRAGNKIVDKDNNEIGIVTSSTLSPSLDKVIGMAYVSKEYLKSNTQFYIDVRGTLLVANLCSLPFL